MTRNKDRRHLLAALPFVPAAFAVGTNGQDKAAAPPLLRYLALDRLDRTLADEERSLILIAGQQAEEIAGAEARMRNLPEMRNAKEQALNSGQLSQEGQEYLRQELTNLMQEEQGLRPQLSALTTRLAETEQRLSKLRQRRDKLAAELAAIEQLFNIRLPE